MSKGKLFVLYIDFKRAFPSLPHKLIKNKLCNMGTGSKFIKILMSLYSRANMSVKSIEGKSERVEVTEGVLQGETLSPAIFNLYTADLEEYLISKGIRGVAINHRKEFLIEGYADDMAIVADNIVEMIKIIKVLREYCYESKLIINVEKQEL